ncbi:protein of unknown function [Candidatus Nitrosotalea okcheonensis]|uniref:Uncharacterized protein n=1 Tax=Candidatus Nitrosotalea okcheonensis TaxID=1903276 RepID=A0A2H1FFI1_9ARCH|nr:protein of unknown function [Candidatus Nitrosotalea okcheonensis]
MKIPRVEKIVIMTVIAVHADISSYDLGMIYMI